MVLTMGATSAFFPLGAFFAGVVVRGTRGEAVAPDNPSDAPVWSEIRDHLDAPGFDGRYVSVADAERQSFHRHPWSIGGGGAAELKERLDEAGREVLKDLLADVGRTTHTGEDEAFFMPLGPLRHAIWKE